MNITTILDHIECRQMALSKFKRDHVWNRDQFRGLFDSRYECPLKDKLEAAT